MSSKRRIGVQDGRKPGWHWASNKVIDEYGAKLGAYGLAVYYALCRHANKNHQCFPALATLAKETGMSARQALRKIKQLTDLGLISKETRTNKFGQTSNLYTLQEVGDYQS